MSRSNQPGVHLLTTGDAAERLGISVSAVRWYANRGVLPVVRDRLGRRLVQAADVRRLAAARRAAAKPRACRFCGAPISPNRKYCAADGCRRRRQRIRWHKWVQRHLRPA
jgi:excisionase family DNA binding protein